MIWQTGGIALSSRGRFNLGAAIGVWVVVARLGACCFLVCGVVHGRCCLCVGCVGWRVDYGVIDQAMWPLQLQVKVYDSRNQVPLYLWLHNFIILFPR